ncbi:LLM class flavin-dependent oxidoreductase [Sciscionella sediminilitoris]|uniref:LLM class flavin-dependent oxidoreductase n=1 Tax=Sciscionella sediminilitoris TaxID=1445613 RepID=UPI0004DF2A24|nr:LLM class flavin-dependent oxidoreductase [Sciscionella sp. SE31]
MRFLIMTLIPHTGETPAADRFRQVVERAETAERLGFDGFGVGERHERPFLSSAPPVVLSHIAARTGRIRLFTTVTTLSLLDPVRAYEDYATLDNLSRGRLELVIGKGNGSAQRELFQVTPEDQWDRNAESYALLRRFWREERVSANPRFRPALHEAEVLPRPFQLPVRVWHGSATSEASADLAARYGDPLFSANVTNPIEPYAALVRHYRERFAAYGHDPALAAVGAGTAGFHVRRNSQDAIADYRPAFAAHLALQQRLGVSPVFPTLEDFAARSSALIGSPEQILDKVHRYHEQLGHTVLHLPAETSGIGEAAQLEALELFQDAIAPALRRDIPDPPWEWGPAQPENLGSGSARKP